MWRLIAKRARAYHRAGRVVTADGEVGVGYTVQVRVWATLPPIANESQRTLCVCEVEGWRGGGGGGVKRVGKCAHATYKTQNLSSQHSTVRRCM